MLAGGKSSRMGRDKALLPFRGGALAGHVAATVAAAAGSATLIGDPQKYGHLGYPVLPDRSPGSGPAGGIEIGVELYSRRLEPGAGLRHARALRPNFCAACWMPPNAPDADALVPAGPSGRLEPLSAVYHRRCLATLRRALEAGVRKITDALAGLEVARWTVDDAACFENLNTPEEWACYATHDAH